MTYWLNQGQGEKIPLLSQAAKIGVTDPLKTISLATICFLFGVWFNAPVNSYGYVEMVS